MGIALKQNFQTRTSLRTVNTNDKIRLERQDSEEKGVGFAFSEVYISDNFAVKLGSAFSFRNHVCSTTRTGLMITEMAQLKPFSRMSLSSGALRMNSLPNAGGSSVKSEVLSYEILQKCFGAELDQTEMEVRYFPEGGPITDYTCKMFGKKLGVSVTRAMKYCGDFTVEDATRLLVKKLNGVVSSTKNTLEGWEKQILHVWTTSFATAMIVTEAYFHLKNEELRSNTVVLVTVASNTKEIFKN